MPLTNTQIQKAKPVGKPTKLADERGLYLLIAPGGSKLWRFKYRYDGKEKLMVLTVVRTPMSNNTILGALERMGYKGRKTGHGFRGVASTLLHEQGFAHAHIEIQLAHQERNAVSAAYNHALYVKERARMMQRWADYLEKLRVGAEVIPLHCNAAKQGGGYG